MASCDALLGALCQISNLLPQGGEQLIVVDVPERLIPGPAACVARLATSWPTAGQGNSLRRWMFARMSCGRDRSCLSNSHLPVIIVPEDGMTPGVSAPVRPINDPSPGGATTIDDTSSQSRMAARRVIALVQQIQNSCLWSLMLSLARRSARTTDLRAADCDTRTRSATEPASKIAAFGSLR
jgi:hypothetical protein